MPRGVVRLLGAAAVMAIVFAAGPVPAQSVTPTSPLYDDAGRAKPITHSARRIITLAPSLTELVYAAGAHEQLVGVSTYSDFPEAARIKPQVADATGVSFEALLALKPDLVLAWKGGTRPADIARLESLGVNVFVIEIRALADVPRVMRTLGKLLGRPLLSDAPERFAATFESTLEKLQVAGIRKARDVCG